MAPLERFEAKYLLAPMTYDIDIRLGSAFGPHLKMEWLLGPDWTLSTTPAIKSQSQNTKPFTHKCYKLKCLLLTAKSIMNPFQICVDTMTDNAKGKKNLL